MSRGIDYGLGTTNIDVETGIRFGVIPINALNEYAWDSMEADYGAPHCPHCGNPATEGETKTEQHANGVTVWTEHPPETEDYEIDRGACGDYRCDDCKRMFDGDTAYGDEPNGYNLDDGEYSGFVDSHNDVMLLKSPFYTRAQFCSPCAPGAAYLTSPCADGPKAYCFGADWFDDDRPCPYPVYRVSDDALIYSPAVETNAE